jgi:hypothetical protein
MTNAKAEFLRHVGERQVRCAVIRVDADYEFQDHAQLPPGYTQEEYDAFLEALDFDYDSGYGSQELDGKIWYQDLGAWSERGEYDGSEWWAFKACPDPANYF